VPKRKSVKHSSEKRNTPAKLKGQRGPKYSAGELFMAGCGALILIMIAGIIITSILGE
jgi:hypothetical protein